MVSLVLTCDLQRGVPAEGGPLHVAGQALVLPAVHLLLAVDSPQEEETPVRQEDPVRGGVRRGCGHEGAVLVPVDDGLRIPCRLEENIW